MGPNPEHLEILKKGVDLWNRWRKGNPEVMPKLNGAELGDAKLMESNLLGAELIKASLKGR